MTPVQPVTTVQRMAFVWSRLALAAVLAAGAACAPAEACPEASASRCDQTDCGDAPRLVCSEGTGFVLFSDGTCGDRDGLDAAIVSDAASAALSPRIAVDITITARNDAPPAIGDVLVVAPKTSPPQT